MTAPGHRRDWEELAEVDPLWAILSFPNKRFGRWEHDEFMATGEAQVAGHLHQAAELGYPAGRRAVLDFGCGVGRLAPALAARFECYCGVDIAENMVAQARHLHGGRRGCRFVTDGGTGLEQFRDGSFDLVISLYVLQHLPRRATVLSYLRTFVRLLAPTGLAVFQLPARIPPAEKLLYGARRRLYLLLRRVGAPPAALHRLDLSPMAMGFVAEDEVVNTVTGAGGQVLVIERARGGMAIDDRTYYVTRPAG